MHFRLLFLAFVLPLLASGQNGLRNYAGAEGIGLGDQSVALQSPASAWINPASVTQQPLAFAVSGERRYESTGIEQLGALAILPSGENSGIGVAIRQMSIGSFTMQEGQLMYARKLFKQINIGAAVVARQMSIVEYGNQTQFNVSIGANADIDENFHVSLVVRDPVSQNWINDEETSPQYLFGVSYKAGRTAVLYSEIEKTLERSADLKFGALYHPIDPLFVRLGFNTAVESIHWGLGYRYRSVQLDLGSSYDFQLGWSPAISLVWQKS